MKKIILLMLLLLIPFHTNALEYKSEVITETMSFEKISFNHQIINDDNKINVYLFRGQGCSHCHDFLEFIDSIYDEYGKYFNLVSYEIWENENNKDLLNKVRATLNETRSGVPYIIIGDKSFLGYGTKYDNAIKKAIVDEYNNTTHYNVIEEALKVKSDEALEIKEDINKNVATNEKHIKSDTLIYIITLSVALIGLAIYLVLETKKGNK